MTNEQLKALITYEAEEFTNTATIMAKLRAAIASHKDAA
jgi:hypothetical protein